MQHGIRRPASEPKYLSTRTATATSTARARLPFTILVHCQTAIRFSSTLARPPGRAILGTTFDTRLALCDNTRLGPPPSIAYRPETSMLPQS